MATIIKSEYKLKLVMPRIRTNSWTHDFFPLFFYNTVRVQKPLVCVELGTYAGYSAYCIAIALIHNGAGYLECYDLWENYPYNHVPKLEAAQNLAGLPVLLKQEDALSAHQHYDTSSVDFLMVDLSNDGATYRKVLTDWYTKISPEGIIIMEGGCKERDEVSWMIKYNKIPIKSIFNDQDINNDWAYTNIGCFPSITIFKKKL